MQGEKFEFYDEEEKKVKRDYRYRGDSDWHIYVHKNVDPSLNSYA